MTTCGIDDSDAKILDERLMNRGIPPVLVVPTGKAFSTRWERWVQTFKVERLHVRLWKEFKQRTGHWPFGR